MKTHSIKFFLNDNSDFRIRRLLQCFNSTLAPSIITIIIFSIFLYKFASSQFQGNITGFSYISENVPVPPVWTENTYIRKDAGYDGMFYYYVAHDPFFQKGFYKYFYDNWTAYRYQRIIYPLTVFLASGGYPPLIPYMMVLVNLVGVGFCIFFLAKIARFYSISPWVSLLFSFYPGLFISVTRNLTEPLQLCLITAALFFYICKNKRIVAILLLSIATLTKETSILIPAALALHEIIKKREIKNLFIFLIPPIVYLLWLSCIFYAIGKWSFATGASQKGEYSLSFVPFLRFFHYLTYKLSLVDFNRLYTHEGFDFLLIFICLIAIVLSFRAINFIKNSTSMPLLVFGIFSTFIADPWVDFYSYSRTIAPLFLFLLCFFLETKDRMSLAPIIASYLPFCLFLKSARVIF